MCGAGVSSRRTNEGVDTPAGIRRQARLSLAGATTELQDDVGNGTNKTPGVDGDKGRNRSADDRIEMGTDGVDLIDFSREEWDSRGSNAETDCPRRINWETQKTR